MPAPSFLSINEFPGDGSTLAWDFNFAGGYLDRSHVKALVRDEFGAPTDISPLTFITDFRVQLPAVIPVGHTLRIYRETPRDAPLVNFTGGSNFTEANLDILARQTILCAAEAFDAGAYAEAFDLLGQAQTAASQANAALVAAVASQAATAASASAAAASASSASGSASTATTQAGIATAQASTATTQAAQATSAKIAAENALTSANAARDTAVAAKDTAVAAEATAVSSASSASTSAATATAGASTATTKAAEAAASAAAAATFDPANYVSKAAGGARLPNWTTATRPASPGLHDFGLNTTLGVEEFWNGTFWQPVGWVKLATASLNGASEVVVDIGQGFNELRVLVPQASHNAGTNQSMRIRVGPLAGVLTSGYNAGSQYTASTGNAENNWATGFTTFAFAASAIISVDARLQRVDGNVWHMQSITNRPGSGALDSFGGFIDVGAELRKLSFLTAGGTFDGGTAPVNQLHVFGRV